MRFYSRLIKNRKTTAIAFRANAAVARNGLSHDEMAERRAAGTRVAGFPGSPGTLGSADRRGGTPSSDGRRRDAGIR